MERKCELNSRFSSVGYTNLLARWNQLFEFMVVKYNDMIIKPTDKNGTFEKTQYGLGARPARPGYPEKYAKELVKQSGDKFLVPESGK